MGAKKNTTLALLPALNLNSLMAPPPDRPGSPSTPTQAVKTLAVVENLATPTNNNLVLDTHTAAPSLTPKVSSISA
jgi:hypothetical protein